MKAGIPVRTIFVLFTMANILLDTANMGSEGLKIYATVYTDAVKIEAEEWGKRNVIGWFRDEVSGIGAAVERALFRSAILPELRQAPACIVSFDYVKRKSLHKVDDFRRATRVKGRGTGRVVVRVPCADDKAWM